MYFISYDQTYTVHARESDLNKNNWLPSEHFVICIDMKNTALKDTEKQLSYSITRLANRTVNFFYVANRPRLCYLGIPPYQKTE